MVNTYVIFLHIHIGHMKCDFWEFESTKNNLWFIFKKYLNLQKFWFYYFYCLISILGLSSVYFYLDRKFPNISNHTLFSQFGSVMNFESNLQMSLCIEFELKEISQFEFLGRGGKLNGPGRGRLSWAGPSNHQRSHAALTGRGPVISEG